MRYTFLIILLGVLLSCENRNSAFKEYDTAVKPIKLGVGSLSTDSVQWNNVFVSKTNELYFTKMGKSASVIHKLDLEDGTFKNLKQIDFPAGTPHSDVYVNSEGDEMLFSSLMQEHANDTISDWNIWKSSRVEGKWQQPTPFFDENIEGNQFYPMLTASGNLYFATTPHGSGNSDIYVSKYTNQGYQQPEALSGIDTEYLEGDPYVAPDESYLIFAGFDRAENLGKSDLFISFNEHGKWTKPVWMGSEINSEGYDGSPF
ncbi:MAG: hypothetical protein P1U56_23835, partial [Saprospiraceae bacterium]|nr:hypothetical protein [Saprospiraceae bacterium]